MILVVAASIASPVLAIQGDTIADRVLGQLDFSHNAVNAVSAGSLNRPEAVAIDASVVPNRLYITDSDNNRVLGYKDVTAFVNGGAADLVIGQPGFVSTTCNNGGASASSLCDPFGVAVDSNGNLYVDDGSNNRVLEYNAPFAGCGSFPCVGGPANLVFGQGGSFTSVGQNKGGVNANSFAGATELAVDVGGNLYVADSGNNRVLEYNTPLTVTATPGSGDTTADMVFGQGGNFSSSACDISAPSASGMCTPFGVALDSNGNLYVAEHENSRVIEYDAPLTNGTTASRVFGQGGNFASNNCNNGGLSASSLCFPFGVTVDAAGHLFIMDDVNDRVLEYDTPLTSDTADRVFGQNGSFTTSSCNNGGLSAGTLCQPTVAAVDSNGNLYLADLLNNRVLEYDEPILPTATPTPTPTATATPTATETSTATATATVIETATVVATATATPTTSTSVTAAIAFGTVAVGQTVTKNVTVTNTGAAHPLIIASATTSDSEYALTGAGTCGAIPVMLAPKTSCTLPVAFTPSTIGAHSASLTINDNAITSPKQVPLNGTGRTTLTDSVTSLRWGNVKFGQKVTRSFILTNHQTEPVSLSESFTGTNAADFSIVGGSCTTTLGALKSCSLVVSFTPGVLAGESATLTIADGPDPLSPYTIALSTGPAVPAVIITPLALPYGTLTSKVQTKTKDVTVTSKTPFALPIIVNILGANANDFQVTGGTCATILQPDSSCTIAVTFTPTGGGIAESGVLEVGVGFDVQTGNAINLTGTTSDKATPTPTASATATLTATPTSTATSTSTATATATLTATATATTSATATAAATASATATTSATAIITTTATPSATPSPGLIPVIFVTNNYQVTNISTVTAYPLGSTGDVPSLIPTGMADPTSVGKDASGRIYIANEEGGASRSGSITIFPAGSTGPMLPTAVISGVHTGLSNPVGIVLDSAGNMYVTNLGGGPTNDGSVTEFAAGSDGDVAPIATITSTGFAVGFPHGIALDPAGNIYVANFIGNNGSISVFAPGSNGNATPIASIAGSNTGIQGPYGVALDSSGNIYVSNHGGGQQNTLSSITVYAPGSNGNVFPIATIIGSDTLLNVPVAIGLDLFGNIYAANSSVVIDGVAYTSGVITVYPPDSSGDVSPSSIIYGANTGLASPSGLLVDSSIYVANFADPDNYLALYSLGANGNVPPTATLSNPKTGLNGPTAIAFDSNRKAYVANSFLSIGQPSGSVTIYPSGGYGVAGAPSATIIGSNTGLTSPSGIALDTTGNIYVSNASGGSSSSGSVTAYAPGSNGNVTPSATIISPDIFDPTGVAVDSLGNIYVSCSIVMGHSIGYTVDIFPALSNGNVIPSSMIMGLQTQLEQPSGLDLDSQRNIYVTNKATNSVTIFAAGSSGNVAPISVISGSNTGLTSPIGVGVDSNGNIYVVNSANSGGGIAGSVTVYAAGSNGNVAPIQTISGGDTGLFAPMGLALGFISQ